MIYVGDGIGHRGFRIVKTGFSVRRIGILKRGDEQPLGTSLMHDTIIEVAHIFVGLVT